MNLFAEILVSFFLVAGGLFGLVGSYGMLKLRETMQRLHSPTKLTTLGVGGVLLGSMAYNLLIAGKLSFHEVLITLFLFLTAPITANFISKAYMARKMRAEELPETSGKHGWSIYSDPPA
jgi:multicomponent K+:H+ antiporter subunit G